MRYLIITKDNEPFYAEWFDFENFYNPDVMVCSFNSRLKIHTFDGEIWFETTEDHL